jgi:hypothetical protein
VLAVEAMKQKSWNVLKQQEEQEAMIDWNIGYNIRPRALIPDRLSRKQGWELPWQLMRTSERYPEYSIWELKILEDYAMVGVIENDDSSSDCDLDLDQPITSYTRRFFEGMGIE